MALWAWDKFVQEVTKLGSAGFWIKLLYRRRRTWLAAVSASNIAGTTSTVSVIEPPPLLVLNIETEVISWQAMGDDR